MNSAMKWAFFALLITTLIAVTAIVASVPEQPINKEGRKTNGVSYYETLDCNR